MTKNVGKMGWVVQTNLAFLAGYFHFNWRGIHFLLTVNMASVFFIFEIFSAMSFQLPIFFGFLEMCVSWTSCWAPAEVFSGATFFWSDSILRDPSWSRLTISCHRVTSALISITLPWSEFFDRELGAFKILFSVLRFSSLFCRSILLSICWVVYDLCSSVRLFFSVCSLWKH